MRWLSVRRFALLGLLLLGPTLPEAGAQPAAPLASAQPATPLGGIERSYLDTFENASLTNVPGRSGQAYRVYHLEFADAASAANFAPEGLTIYHRDGRFVNLFAPPSDKVLETIAEAPKLRWLDYDRTIDLPEVPRPEPIAPTRSSKEAVARLGVGSRSGKGVIVAVVDSGFDVRHPDFQVIGPDGHPRTRFRALWDTTEMRPGLGRPAPLAYPNGQPIGVIYSREDIDRYLATPEEKRPEILWDGNGHGTSCAGIAAGNGRALEGAPYAGVASQADLIGVRVGDGAQNTYLTPALLAWLDEQAGDTAMVISNSWGSQRAGRDGNSLMERQIDARFPPDRPGRLVLFAAGNQGTHGLHALAEYAGEKQPGVLQLPAVTEKDDAEVTVYFNTADRSLRTNPAIDGSAYIHGLTGQLVFRFSLQPGIERLEIFSEDGNAGHFDAYIAGEIGGKKAFFDSNVARFEGLVNNPGTCENVLTVGSYDFNPTFEQNGRLLTLGVGEEKLPMTVGDISVYSSPGLTRLGRLKPDLVAPGQWWTATAPLIDSDQLAYDTSGYYNLFNGTSAATPYTAGVMALLLEKNPRLSLNQVRTLLDRHLKPDAYTGPLPNPTWGRGKLTLRAVETMLEELETP